MTVLDSLEGLFLVGGARLSLERLMRIVATHSVPSAGSTSVSVQSPSVDEFVVPCSAFVPGQSVPVDTVEVALGPIEFGSPALRISLEIPRHKILLCNMDEFEDVASWQRSKDAVRLGVFHLVLFQTAGVSGAHVVPATRRLGRLLATETFSRLFGCLASGMSDLRVLGYNGLRYMDMVTRDLRELTVDQMDAREGDGLQLEVDWLLPWFSGARANGEPGG